jgi:phytoene synthase
VTLESAYRYCEEVTSSQAKNFAYGIRLLRPPERRAMTAVYAMARKIDDITDGDLPPERKLEALAAVRKDLDGSDPTGHDPVLTALADVAVHYRLPFDAFGDLIDGCEMDVTGVSYVTRDDLVVYCRRVAGSIGRLSLAIFTCRDPEVATPLADDLGVALQLTNILRDVLEDRAMGRVYLPADDAGAVGCPPDLVAEPDALARLVGYECPYAVEWFDRGLQLLPLLDRRSRACVSAMAGIYRRLLDRMAGDPAAVTQGRVSVPTWEKGWVAVSSLAGMGTKAGASTGTGR